jgi:hypothetical protein
VEVGCSGAGDRGCAGGGGGSVAAEAGAVFALRLRLGVSVAFVAAAASATARLREYKNMRKYTDICLYICMRVGVGGDLLRNNMNGDEHAIHK